jgi:hypothetical protein
MQDLLPDILYEILSYCDTPELALLKHTSNFFYDRVSKKSPVCQGVMNGDLPFLIWCREQNYTFPPKVVSLATKYRHLDIIQWFVKMKMFDPNYIAKYACAKGDIQTLEWFRETRKDIRLSYATEAASCNQLAVIQWLQKNNYSLNIRNLAVCINGSLELLLHVKESLRFNWTYQCTYFALSRGRLDILKYGLAQNWFGVDDLMILHARLTCNIELFEWLVSLGCVVEKECIRAACTKGYFEVVKWFHTHHYIKDNKLTTFTAKANHLDVFDWLVAEGYAVPANICTQVADKASIQTLRHLVDKGYTVNEDTAKVAVENKLSVLQYLRLDLKCPWNIDVCIAAISLSKVPTLDWLLEEGFEIQQEDVDRAMLEVCWYDFEMMKEWLEDHGLTQPGVAEDYEDW